jgi:hypothetical protein
MTPTVESFGDDEEVSVDHFAPRFVRLSSSSKGSLASGERTNGSSPVTAQNSRGGPLG